MDKEKEWGNYKMEVVIRKGERYKSKILTYF
jgi:hypothetical protein